MNDFVKKYQSRYKAMMLPCWPAKLGQHSSYTTLPSIIRQHPSSGSLLHLFKSLDMYSLMGIPDTRGILHCKAN